MASFSSISCFFKISAPDSGPFSVHFSSTSFSSRISIVGMFTADRGYPRKKIEIQEKRKVEIQGGKASFSSSSSSSLIFSFAVSSILGFSSLKILGQRFRV